MDENPTFEGSNSITIDFDVFKREVIDDEKLTLLAFLADWRGPCQILDHILTFLKECDVNPQNFWVKKQVLYFLYTDN